jgi:anti-anti-sigma factor
MFHSRKQGALHVVSGDQCLNVDAVDEAREVFEGCLAQGQPRVILSLDKVPLIDSAGLELLLDVQELCIRRGGALRLAAPSPLCRDILQVTGVAEHFEIFDDVLAAAGSFAV